MKRTELCGVLLAMAVSAGCATAGPEVRVTPADPDWLPGRLVLLPPAVPPGAIPPAKGLPSNVAPVLADEVQARTMAALESSLREKSSALSVASPVEFSRTDTGALAERVRRQYLDTRLVDPSAAAALGGGLNADSVLLTVILKYGPEAEEAPRQAAQNAQTKFGKKSDLAISSSATRTTVWFNIHVRCALLRTADGAVMWDASIRNRRRHSLLEDVTMETVADDAVTKLLSVFPWLKPVPTPEGSESVSPVPGASKDSPASSAQAIPEVKQALPMTIGVSSTAAKESGPAK